MSILPQGQSPGATGSRFPVSRFFGRQRGWWPIVAALGCGLAGVAPAAQPGPGHSLRVVVQNGYLPGVPVLVRAEIRGINGAVDRTIWDAEATFSTDQPGVLLSTNKATLRNGLGSALVTFTGGADFNLNVVAGSLSTNRPLTSLVSAPMTSVAGALPAGTTTWSGVIRVTGDVTVPAGSALILEPDTLVLVDGVASGTTAPDLFISGAIQSLGTEDYPVTITCSDGALRWGQIRHDSASPSLYRYTSITRGGRAAGEGHTGTAPLVRPSASTLVFENCNFTDLADTVRGSATYGTPGKVMSGFDSDLTFRDCLLTRARMGPEIQGTALLMTNCWILEMRGPDDSDGFYIHAQQPGQSCAFQHCVIAGGDDDGLDTLDSVVEVEECIIRDWNNLLEDAKGISVFNGATHVRRSLVVDSTVGINAKWSGGAPTVVTINHSTIGGCLTDVMAGYKANAPGPFIDIRVTNCVIWGGKAAHSDFADTNFTIVYTDLSDPWAGTGNLNLDPLFANVTNHDFRLLPGSPCINAGDPASPLDADGSRADMGYLAFDPTQFSTVLVSLTAPFDGAVLRAPTDLTLAATASSTTGSVARVEFFQGAASLGVDIVEPFSLVWSNVGAGSYTLTAVATENGVKQATSAPVRITLVTNFAPVVGLTSPADNAVLIAPGLITITADASDVDGNLSKVEFFQGATKLGEAASSPFACSWNDPPAGSYTLTAVASDGAGLHTTSAPVHIVVQSSELPWGGLQFDGSSQYVSFGGAPTLGASNFTLEAWVKWTGGGVPANSGTGGANAIPVITKGRGEGDNSNVDCNYFFGIQTDGRLAADFEEYPTTGAGGANHPIVGVTPVTANVWHHVAVTYDGTNWSLYLDGALDNQLAVGKPPRWDSIQQAALGSALTSAGAAQGFFAGVLDEARVWNYARSALQIASGKDQPIVAAPGLLGRWSLDETTGVIAHDSSGNGVDGTTLNNPAWTWGYPFVAGPRVVMTAPLEGAAFYTPGNIELAATATPVSGTVIQVDFFAGAASLGTAAASPHTFIWTNPPPGSYALTAVATDSSGLKGTSAPVSILVSTNLAPPVVWDQSPAPGTVSNLTEVTVTFSRLVAGVNAADLLINGLPAGGLSGSGSNYTFLFAQPAYGPVSIAWAANHGITDVLIPPQAFDANGPGATWQYQLSDLAPPVATTLSPAPGAVVPALTSASVTFSENVSGVDAADLLINNAAAASVAGSGPGPYVFTFPQPAGGLVSMTWAAGHGIRDAAGLAFLGAAWTCTLDTNVAGVVISEIMYHPQSENTLEEYLELFNSGPTAVNVAGWRLTRGLRFTFPDVTIPAGGWLAVAADVSAFTNRHPGVTNVVGGWEGLLSNSRNTLDLEDALGRRVNSVRYADEGDWAIRQRSEPHQGYQGWHWLKEHDGHGKSLELINPTLPNQHGQNWTASLATNGTPGRANSVAAANIPPLILEAQHVPVIPGDADPVIVSARMLDERASNVTVTLHWRVDAASPPPFASTNMYDDGTHGDGVAGDGLFGATLPPQAQSAIVEFYLRAQDQDGLVRTWPAAVLDTSGGSLGQVCNALYQVDTNRSTADQPIYRAILTERERAVLWAIQHGSYPGTSQSDATLNGTFISVDGTGTECRYGIGVKNRGHGTRNRQPNNHRINFNADNPWKGVIALNLNGQYTHAQIFGAAIAQRSGLAGADSRAVQFRVNSTNLALLDNYPVRTYGSYAANEAINPDWSEHHFPSDSSGNLYRTIRDIAPPEMNYRGPGQNAYTNTYFKLSNTSQDDWTDLVGLLRIIGTNDLFSAAAARQVADVDQWMRHVALMSIFANQETGLHTGYNDDYSMYCGQVDRRFVLLYYDLDSILSEGSGPLATNSAILSCTNNNGSGLTFHRLLSVPEFRLSFLSQMQEMLNTTFSAPQFGSLLNQVLGSYVPSTTLQRMTNWMNGRRAFLQTYLDANLPPITNLPVVTLAGEPRSPTPFNFASLTVSGPDVIAYRASLNGGPYGEETPVGLPLSLFELADGSTNTVSVIGKDANGVWQSPSSPTVSRTWVVNTALPAVRLNEVLARNVSGVDYYGQHPDLIELYNEGGATLDLAGLGLTNDPASPHKFVFPPGTTLAPGAHLVAVAGNVDGTPGLHLGFALSQDGEGLYLFDTAARGGGLLDSVVFGLQLADLSLGRLGSDGRWVLAQPTLGFANVAQPTGQPSTLKINEWLALGQGAFADDFIEIYNPDPLPVSLGGLYLSEEPFGAPNQHPIADLSFVAGLGFRAFIADGQPDLGAAHLNFQLAAEQGQIALGTADRTPIDSVWYGPQTLNVPLGRCPDGGPGIISLSVPTPGSGNACPSEPPPPQIITLLVSTNTWRYDQSGTDLGTLWRGTDYDDSAWPQGPGVLGYSGTALPEPINTPLSVGSTKTNFYFRTTFFLPSNVTFSALQATHLIDDGAVFYLNGQEAYRYNMPAGTILATTFASGTIDASTVGPVTLPITNLHAGTNLLSVEVHQSTRTSSDIVLGCQLDLVVLTNTPVGAGLVLNEVLANNNGLQEADGATPDWVELFNPADTGVDLADMSLSDTAATPRRWVFPPGAAIGPRGWLVVHFDAGAPVSAGNSGFGLNADGDSVYLFDKPSNGGGVVDYITFGLQTADFSIGRVPDGATNWVLTLPTPGAANLAAPLGDAAQLKFNEWMASPASGSDWFEIYNPQSLPVALAGLWLTDNLAQWDGGDQLPPLAFIGGRTNGYQRFWADNQSGGAHVNFGLKAAGENLGLFQPDGLLIDGVVFGPQQSGISEGRLPDGASTRVFFPETPTPGNANYLLMNEVVINEVLAHTDPPFEDAIELFNPTAAAVDISNWWLSDANDTPRKYRIPPGTVLIPGAFAVFYEYQFNGTDLTDIPFALSSAKGDEVYLSATDTNGLLTGYRATAKFGPSANRVSFGRYLTSTGEAEFPSLSQRSLGADNPSDLAEFRTGTGLPNPYPLVGPVVISEVMYHPIDLGGVDNVTEEFVQLENRAAQTVFLYDTNYPTNTWRLRDAVDFDFPPDLRLAPGGRLVIVSFDPVTNLAALAQFQAKYGSNATLLGPYSGKLDNRDESIELYQPDAPELLAGPDFGFVPYVRVDRVHYRDLTPWPTNADGGGDSLHRLSLSGYGNDPTNWFAAAPTPGGQGPADSDGDGMSDEWETAHGLDAHNPADAALDPDGDRQSNLDEFLSGTDPQDPLSVLRIDSVASSGSGAEIRFLAIAGHSYSVQHRPAVESGTWTNLAAVPVRATNRMATVPDPEAGAAPPRFYRLVTPAQP
jgi:hypothetical protein